MSGDEAQADADKGVPEGGTIPVRTAEQKAEDEARMQKVMEHDITIRCEKCHKERAIKVGELVRAKVGYIKVTFGKYPGVYLQVSCNVCGYPLARETRVTPP